MTAGLRSAYFNEKVVEYILTSINVTEAEWEKTLAADPELLRAVREQTTVGGVFEVVRPRLGQSIVG